MGRVDTWGQRLAAIVLVWILVLQSFFVVNTTDSSILDPSKFFSRDQSKVSRRSVRRTPISHALEVAKKSTGPNSHIHEESAPDGSNGDDHQSNDDTDQNVSKDISQDDQKSSKDKNKGSEETSSPDGEDDAGDGSSEEADEKESAPKPGADGSTKADTPDAGSSEDTTSKSKDADARIIAKQVIVLKEVEGLFDDIVRQIEKDKAKEKTSAPKVGVDMQTRMTEVEALKLPFLSDDSTVCLPDKSGYSKDHSNNVLRPEPIVEEIVVASALQKEKDERDAISSARAADKSGPPPDEDLLLRGAGGQKIFGETLIPVTRIHRLPPKSPRILQSDAPLTFSEPLHTAATSDTSVIPAATTPSSVSTINVVVIAATSNTTNTSTTNTNTTSVTTNSTSNNNTTTVSLVTPAPNASNTNALGDITNRTNVNHPPCKSNQSGSGSSPSPAFQRIRLLGKSISSKRHPETVVKKNDTMTAPPKNNSTTNQRPLSTPEPKNNKPASENVVNPYVVNHHLPSTSGHHHCGSSGRSGDNNLLLSSEPSAGKELEGMSYLSIGLFTSLCVLLMMGMAVLGFNMRKTYRASTAHPPPTNFVDTRLEQTTVEPVPSFA